MTQESKAPEKKKAFTVKGFPMIGDAEVTDEHIAMLKANNPDLYDTLMHMKKVHDSGLDINPGADSVEIKPRTSEENEKIQEEAEKLAKEKLAELEAEKKKAKKTAVQTPANIQAVAAEALSNEIVQTAQNEEETKKEG